MRKIIVLSLSWLLINSSAFAEDRYTLEELAEIVATGPNRCDCQIAKGPPPMNRDIPQCEEKTEDGKAQYRSCTVCICTGDPQSIDPGNGCWGSWQKGTCPRGTIR